MDVSRFQDAVIRRKCENDFLFFVRYFFFMMTGQKFIVNHHHKRIAKYLRKCTLAEVLRLIVNMPPRYGKTELIVVMFIAWCIMKNPKAKFIHLSYSDELAFDNSSRIKEIILSDAFQRLWPHIVLKDDAKSKKKWYTKQGGGLYATSSGGAVTGFGAGSTADSTTEDMDTAEVESLKEELNALGLFLDMKREENTDNLFYGAIIIDDPIKPGDAESKQKRKVINERMDGTIGSRVNSRKTPIIVVMQRLHEEDTTGFLLDPDRKTKWTRLMIPALEEDEQGNLIALWPFKHTLEELIEIRDNSPYIFAGQYQQTPTPPKGGMIDTSCFGRYKEVPVEFEQIVMSCDTSYSKKATADPSVALVFGKFSNHWYLIHIWRKRCMYPELKRSLYALYDRFRPHAILVENKASGQSLIPEMREDGLPAISIEPEADKITRMNTQAPLIEAGLIYVPDSREQFPFLYEFLDECINFPLSKTKDQVDSLSQFLKWTRTSNIGGWSVGGDQYDQVIKEMIEEDEFDDFYDDFDDDY
ncbi:TPA: phage terminase large subunit [Vibrio parahaemolyticus]|nr:phage terminase large subunit [Vibrio parahaemolyticus]HCG7105655.1 phage terminase large subunit [Vibrio parahaemolyticus]